MLNYVQLYMIYIHILCFLEKVNGNVNHIATRHVTATLMSAIRSSPGATGFIISGQMK